MKLDKRGDIAIAEVVLYIPILIVAVMLTIRHGLTRKAGWLFFIILSLARIIGGIGHVASEQNPSNVSLQILWGVLEAAGLSPLLMATFGFLGTVGQYTSLESLPVMSGKVFHLFSLLGTVGVVLAIIGGMHVGEAKTQSDLNSGLTFRHVSSILFTVLFVISVLLTAFCWKHRDQIMKYRRKLLLAIIASLPFLSVRVVFSVLSSFAPLTYGIDASGQRFSEPSNSSLETFASGTGNVFVYLVMSVLMEYIVVLIYTVTGLRLPLQQDATDFQRPGMHLRMMSGAGDEEGYTYKAAPLMSSYDTSSYA